MLNSDKSIVNINFNGLFLFMLDEQNKSCEAKICTAANDHQMEIRVYKKGGMYRYPSNDKEKFYSIDDLRGFGSLKLHVYEQGTHLKNSLKKGSINDSIDYDSILNLADERLYGNKVILKEGYYEASFSIHNGTVGGLYENDECNQVDFDVFKDVSFYISKDEWKNTLNNLRNRHPGSVKDSDDGFAPYVRVIIELNEGQIFRIIWGDANHDLISPITGFPGENCDIWIKYLDKAPPKNLKDCMGIGHHSDAVRPENERIWTFFRPLRGGETEGACCEAVCISRKH